MTGRLIAWVNAAPADYMLVFVEDPDGEHAVVHARFGDEDGAESKAESRLEGFEIAENEVRVYCTLPGEPEQVLARLGEVGAEPTSVNRGTISFVAVGDGTGTNPEHSLRDAS